MKKRVTRWLLLSGHRRTITIGVLSIMTGVVLLPVFTGVSIRNLTPLSYMATGLVGGNITLITVVVTINQLILSEELASPGTLQEEIDRTERFQHEALDQPTPPTEPTEFLQQLLLQTRDRARSLERLHPDSTQSGDIRLLTELPDRCEQDYDQLQSASNSLPSLIVPFLGTNYADYLHEAYGLLSRCDDDCHAKLRETVETLISDLENLNIAQQYFTAAFMKEELATLSRFLVYVGIVAVATPLALLYELATQPGANPPMARVYALSVLTVIVGLLPLAVLIAFILRISTITQSLAVNIPFKG